VERIYQKISTRERVLNECADIMGVDVALCSDRARSRCHREPKLSQSPVTPLGPQGNILKGQSSELKISVRRKSDVWQSVDGIKGKQDEGNR
jgi:hypothetical protein